MYIHIRYTLYTLKRQPSSTVICKQKVNRFEGSELDFQASKFFMGSNPDFFTSSVFVFLFNSISKDILVSTTIC